MFIELLFFVIVGVNFFFIYLAQRLGKEYLTVMLVMNIMVATTFAGQITEFLGILVTLGTLFYVPIFIITNIYNENYSEEETKKVVNVSLFSLVVVLILLKLGTKLPSSSETTQIGEALNVLFDINVRVTIGIIVGYYLSQLVNIYLYRKIGEITKKKFLWLRHNAALIIALGADSFIFCPIAFYGNISTEAMFTVIGVSWIVKSIVSIVATPIMYFSRNKKTDQDNQVAQDDSKPVPDEPVSDKPIPVANG